MAWSYFVICLSDFLFFPIFNAVWYSNAVFHEWKPLTLQGGGLYHLAMGGIIGVATWQRTQEKIAAYSASAPGSVTIEKTVEKSSSVTAAAPAPVVQDQPASSRKD